MPGRRLKSMAWSALDPVLRRLMQRMEILRKQEGRVREIVVPAGVTLGKGVRIDPGAELVVLGKGEGSIDVGHDSHIQGKLQTFWNGGRIQLGHHCYVGAGTQIWSQSSIRIGDHVLISHLVDIHDTDSHPLSAAERRLDAEGILQTGIYRTPTATRSAPIVIEDDVWISAKATVLKGVTIGKGSIVAANAVVTRDVEPYSIVAGNPARVIGSAEP